MCVPACKPKSWGSILPGMRNPCPRTFLLICLVWTAGAGAAERDPTFAEISRIYAASRNDPITSTERLKRIAAINETPQAALYLGLIYETGRTGIVANKDLALDYYIQAADKNSVAAFNAGRLFLQRKKPAEAASFLALAANDKSNPVVQAMVLLAGMHENGLAPGGTNMQKAAHWYKKAAAYNDPLAMGKTGHFMVRGIGQSRDPRVGKILLNRAADAGNGDALYSLWEMHAKGIGVRKNPVEATKWAIILKERKPAYGTSIPLLTESLNEREEHAARQSAEIWGNSHQKVVAIDYLAPIITSEYDCFLQATESFGKSSICEI